MKELIKTKSSSKDVSISSIALEIVKTVKCVYGVLKLMSYKRGVSYPLDEINYKNNVLIKKTKNGYDITLYIVCLSDIKVIEVASEVQKQVIYNLKRKLKIDIKAVNVLVCSL